MALSDITINDSAETPVVFGLTAVAGQKATYADGSRAVDEPRTLVLSHQITGKGSSARYRHLLRFDRQEVDDDGVTTGNASCYVVLDVPAKAITADHVQDMVVMLTNALTPTNVTKLLANQFL